MKILFVCRYNRFRSRVAEAYFKKINKKKGVYAKSAGLFKGNPLSEFTVKVCKELGLDIKGKPQGISSNLYQWQDTTIVVANDVPPAVFDRNKEYGKKLIIWDIPDTERESEEDIKNIIKAISDKIDDFYKSLN